jgi:hypothetical protein
MTASFGQSLGHVREDGGPGKGLTLRLAHLCAGVPVVCASGCLDQPSLRRLLSPRCCAETDPSLLTRQLAGLVVFPAAREHDQEFTVLRLCGIAFATAEQATTNYQGRQSDHQVQEIVSVDSGGDRQQRHVTQKAPDDDQQ